MSRCGRHGRGLSRQRLALDRDVAIKVSAAQFSERFEREAKAIVALNHPDIRHLYDIGPNCLVMEFIEGEAPSPIPSTSCILRFVEILVLGVLRTLQGQLKCQTLLGDLVHQHSRRNHRRS